MRDITDYELQQSMSVLIEKACSILADAADITDELSSILASICVGEECAQIADILSQSENETSLKPV